MVAPTGLIVIPYLSSVGERLASPVVYKKSLRFARAVGDACPYSRNIRFRTNIVGDDVLGVPFIKISLRFVRTTGGRPYRFINDE